MEQQALLELMPMPGDVRVILLRRPLLDCAIYYLPNSFSTSIKIAKILH